MSAPYMPLFVADYLGDTSHLTTVEHGAYMLLMMTYWQRGKALPDDVRRLANIARMTPEDWAEVEPVIAEFFTVAGGAWTHGRIEQELARARDKSEKAAAAGKASAAKRATDVQRTFNGRSTDVQPTQAHTQEEGLSTPPPPVPEAARAEPDADRVGVEDFASRGVGAGAKAGERPAAGSAMAGRVAALMAGCGLGGEVSPEAKRRVCRDLGLADCEPLVAIYRDWPKSRTARNPDALFIRSAASIWKNALPEVRARCKPPEPFIAPAPVKVSPELAASLAKLCASRAKAMHTH